MTDEKLKEDEEKNPQIKTDMENLEKFIDDKISQSSAVSPDLGTGVDVIYIPVIFHVLYNAAEENIPDSQLESQINVLNTDFAAENADISNVPNEFQDEIGEYGIKFYTDRIIRKQTTKTSWSKYENLDDLKYDNTLGSSAIDTSHYLNFWVVNLKELLGFAQFPGEFNSKPDTDGVVCDYRSVGSINDDDGTFVLRATYNLGRTATHEVGHWLDLRHIWGDGGCGYDDLVADTPTDDGANYGCPAAGTNSCGTNDMFMNYMDYVDDSCMVMFTSGQIERSQIIFEEGGPRHEFVENQELCINAYGSSGTYINKGQKYNGKYVWEKSDRVIYWNSWGYGWLTSQFVGGGYYASCTNEDIKTCSWKVTCAGSTSNIDPLPINEYKIHEIKPPQNKIYHQPIYQQPPQEDYNYYNYYNGINRNNNDMYYFFITIGIILFLISCGCIAICCGCISGFAFAKWNTKNDSKTKFIPLV